MNNFKGYITEEKNTHMTHIEDLVLDGDVNGVKLALNHIENILNELQGHSTVESRVGITVKWDGSPAVFAGTDPQDGKFFVAKKGIFNKNPKVYKSHADIIADTEGDLQKKLIVAFDNLKLLGIEGVIQGDIMFTNDDLKHETIDGEDYVVFHPNTLAYAIPTKEADDILSAEIGVVFHTQYHGKTFEEMKASYGVDITNFKKTKSVWAVSAGIPELKGVASFTSQETKQLEKTISDGRKLLQSIPSGLLRDISQHTELNALFNTFGNQLVRMGRRVVNSKAVVGELMKFIHDRHIAAVDKLKTDAAKDKKHAKHQEIVDFFNKYGVNDIAKIYDLQKTLVTGKEIIINKLNQIGKLKTFVKTNKGFQVTGVEGFVAIDRIGGGAVKLVNRLEFSRNNFDPNVIKGWQR